MLFLFVCRDDAVVVCCSFVCRNDVSVQSVAVEFVVCNAYKTMEWELDIHIIIDEEDHKEIDRKINTYGGSSSPTSSGTSTVS